MNDESWPALPGTYILVLEAAASLTIQVGRLRPFQLLPGCYAYIGSARGSGGLRARVRRHLRPTKRRRWHIDALTTVLPVIGVITSTDPRSLECAWVRRLLALPGATAPSVGFGSSDCRAGCPAHLVRLPTEFDWETWDTDEVR